MKNQNNEWNIGKCLEEAGKGKLLIQCTHCKKIMAFEPQNLEDTLPGCNCVEDGKVDWSYNLLAVDIVKVALLEKKRASQSQPFIMEGGVGRI